MATPATTEGGGPPPLYLAGPTASGKSAVALALAELVPAEIISVDSALVYRGMDIGTAKPTPAERAAAPHHLIDIRARGRLPVLVGGTMLYFKALYEGLDDLPPADAAVRRQIEERAAQEGWPALHAELARVDPITAARLAPGDSQRIQRALEVWQLTGQPMSALHTTKSGAACAQQTGAGSLFSLEPADRAWLHGRIAQRFDDMLAGGLVDEVTALRARGDLTPDMPSMRCVGYRQVWDTLDGRAPADTLRERGIAATRQLAKRQLTWLRGMPERQVLAVDDKTSAVEMAQRLLDRTRLDNF